MITNSVRMSHRAVLLFFCACLNASLCRAQATAVAATAPRTKPGYVLGPDDQFTVRGMHADEIVDKPYRIEANGAVTLPLLGQMPAGGLTIEQFQTDLTKRLKRYYFEPQISVSVTEFRSQPVSVLGAVGSPGVHQLQ